MSPVFDKGRKQSGPAPIIFTEPPRPRGLRKRLELGISFVSPLFHLSWEESTKIKFKVISVATARCAYKKGGKCTLWTLKSHFYFLTKWSKNHHQNGLINHILHWNQECVLCWSQLIQNRMSNWTALSENNPIKRKKEKKNHHFPFNATWDERSDSQGECIYLINSLNGKVNTPSADGRKHLSFVNHHILLRGFQKKFWKTHSSTENLGRF